MHTPIHLYTHKYAHIYTQIYAPHIVGCDTCKNICKIHTVFLSDYTTGKENYFDRRAIHILLSNEKKKSREAWFLG